MTPNIPTTSPEGAQGSQVNSGTTNNDINTLLDGDQVALRMKSRNLNYAEVGENLVHQLKEYMEGLSKDTMVMGVSGGVDSGLVSTLAAKTGLKLIVIEMPIHQAEDQVTRAQNHIAWLKDNFPNVKSERIDLSNTFDTIRVIIPGLEKTDKNMALVNTRSRLRGDVLYAVANQHKGIVLGTGNRVEDYGIGFFTKFGDGAVDISPIGELYKSEVRALSRELGISEAISEAIATDGLHTDGATDEQQIGCTYNELEWAMVEYDKGKRTKDFEKRAKEVMEIYSTRHERSRHKMEMPPVFSLNLD